VFRYDQQLHRAAHASQQNSIVIRGSAKAVCIRVPRPSRSPAAIHESTQKGSSSVAFFADLTPPSMDFRRDLAAI
jgi:hypothetical protein